MRRIWLLLVILPFVLLIGCDGGGSSSGSAVTISTGTVTVGTSSSEQLASFTVGEPGQVVVTATWTGGPAQLTLVVEAQGGGMAANIGGSALVTSINVTQEILDSSNLLVAGVINNDATDSAQVEYTIVFTPSG